MIGKFSIRFLALFGVLLSLHETICLLSRINMLKKNLPEIYEVNDRVKALEFYNTFGVNVKTKMCNSIDRKTSWINGYALCIFAFKKKYEKKPHIKNVKVICQHTPVDKNIYKYAKLMKSNLYGPNTFAHFMVHCMFGHNKPTFYLLNAKDDYYYIFEHKPLEINVSITACLRITQMNIDWPKLELRKTNDPQEANDIFGVFGAQHFNRFAIESNHVCQEVQDYSNVFLADTVCATLLWIYNFVKPPGFVECQNVQLTRAFVNDQSNLPELSNYQRMAKCNYYLNFRLQCFMIVNTKNDNLIYVARYFNKKLIITNIMSITDLKKF